MAISEQITVHHAEKHGHIDIGFHWAGWLLVR
jgi:hypothetical protein